MAKKKQASVSMDHFAPFIKAKEELDKKIRAEGEVAVKAFLKEYFDKNPEVYGLKWTQYTPFFNDGDACEFGLHGVNAFPDKELFESDTESWDNDAIEEVYGEGTIQESLEEVTDILQAVFGDHAEVCVTRKKIDVKEYDHE